MSKNLADFQGLHSGRTIYLFGNGPSLAQMDLSSLKNELTFGCNRIYIDFARIGYQTTFWALEDALDAKQYSNDLKSVGSVKFIPNDLRRHAGFEDCVGVPFNRGPVEHPGFAVAPPFEWGGTVMHLMLQLAVFMGCAEVILLGNDFRWNMDGVVEGGRTWTTDGPDANHFSPDYWPKGFQSFPPNPAVMRRAFVAAREGCEAMGVKVYNATPNSGLDVFEQIELVGVTP